MILLLVSAVIMLKETFEYQDCHVSMLLNLEMFANMEECGLEGFHWWGPGINNNFSAKSAISVADLVSRWSP